MLWITFGGAEERRFDGGADFGLRVVKFCAINVVEASRERRGDKSDDCGVDCVEALALEEGRAGSVGDHVDGGAIV